MVITNFLFFFQDNSMSHSVVKLNETICKIVGISVEFFMFCHKNFPLQLLFLHKGLQPCSADFTHAVQMSTTIWTKSNLNLDTV